MELPRKLQRCSSVLVTGRDKASASSRTLASACPPQVYLALSTHVCVYYMHTSWQSNIGGGFCFPRPSARNRTMHMHVSTAAAPAQAASAGVADALPALARLFFSELLQLFEGLLP